VLDHALDQVQIRGAWRLFIPVLGFMLGAAAVVKPTIALGIVLGVIFIALAMLDFAAGVAAFVLLSFFERFPGIPGSEVSVIKGAGVVLVVAWLAHLATGRGSLPLLTASNPVIAYAAIAVVVVAFISVLWASDADTARTTALRFAQGPILLFIVFSAIRTPDHFRWVAWAYLAGAVATAIIGIGKTPADTADIGRLSGGIRDPNELAAALLPAIPIALFSMPVVRRALTRWMLLAAVSMIAVAIFMTGSRGGLVGLGVMFLAAILLSGPLRQQVVFGILVVTGVAMVYYTLFAPPVVLWRLTNFSAEGGSGRTDLWSVAMQMWHDHPLLGVGAGNFQILEPSYALSSINLPDIKLVLNETKVVHNTYLHVLVELGIVGFACFTIVVLGGFIVGLKSVRSFGTSDNGTGLLARGFLIGMTGMFAAYTFISGQNEKQLWLLVSVALALQTVSRAQSFRSESVDLRVARSFEPKPKLRPVPSK
jgi:O-antigen ligase